LGERGAVKTLLLLLAIGSFVALFGGFVWGLTRGRVGGAHPIKKKVAWIERSEHPKHFWGYTLLHIVVFLILAWMIFGLWTARVI
jgi:hypothetical protein